MALAPEPSTEDLAAHYRGRAIDSWGKDEYSSLPPILLAEDYPDLLKAGINDWGGISPVTKDFINPEAAWPQISALAARSAGAGFVLRERLAIYPEFASRPEFRKCPCYSRTCANFGRKTAMLDKECGTC